LAAGVTPRTSAVDRPTIAAQRRVDFKRTSLVFDQPEWAIRSIFIAFH
jgi:hypothetical protein